MGAEEGDGVGLSSGLEKALADCKQRNDLLCFVKEVQREKGYLSGQDMKDIATLWGCSLSEVYSVATFYAFLSTRPRAENLVLVCKSAPCCLKKAQVVIEAVQRELGINPGQSTRDGRFALQLVNCIGACDQAPVMMINDNLFQSLAPEDVLRILRSYR